MCDTKEVIRSSKSKDRQHNGQKNKRTNKICKTLHRKLQIEPLEPYLQTRGEHMSSRRVDSSCFSSCTRRVTLITNPVISHESGKDRIVITTSGTYQWSFVTRIFRNGQPNHVKISTDDTT